MAAQATGEEMAMLAQEVSLLRAELAAVRSAQEEREEVEARLRASRQKAAKAADTLARALAEKLRLESLTPQKKGLLSRSGSAVTDEERQQVELIRASALFDAGWYLRQYLDVVRSGEEPTLHFLRHPIRPLRQPGPDFDTGHYLDDHPEVLELGVNPLVHFLLSPESAGADRYPPEG